MPGGNKNIRPEDGVQFEKGNKAAEKWTEEAALKFGNDMLDWMQGADENIFFDEFIYLINHKEKYAGKIYADLPGYLAKKYSSFLDILNKCRKIEETKLKKFSAFDKLNASIAKFLLSAEYNYREKSDMTTKGEKIEVADPFAQIRKNHGIETDEETTSSE